MAITGDYQSQYTGAQVDQALGKANTALQPSNIKQVTGNSVNDTMSQNAISTALATNSTAINNVINGTTVVANANDSAQINGLAIDRDINGILKIGDTIIPQKILLWSGTSSASSSATTSITFSQPISIGDNIEIIYGIQEVDNDTIMSLKANIIGYPMPAYLTSLSTKQSFLNVYSASISTSICQISNSTTLEFTGAYDSSWKIPNTADSNLTSTQNTIRTINIYKIYKIIE